jgi:hypothetical protein
VSETMPKDVGEIDGARELYEEFQAARAARDADKTPETIRRFNAAAAALDEARTYWRGIRQWIRAEFEATADMLAAQADGAPNPDTVPSQVTIEE